MPSRDFSDSVKLAAITENLKTNNGDICCATCGIKLNSITECHFDHVFPFSKGGKSTLDNCQILCVSCNLKKTDKELHEFFLEEKAKRFFAGETESPLSHAISTSENPISYDRLTKDEFDKIVKDFIARNGNIHTIDFCREYNNLPSVHYVKKFYGDLRTLKKEFGIEDLSYSWNRDSIKAALENYVKQHGDILQKDLKKENKLPSLPCILVNYPEFTNFTDIKKGLLHLPVRERWNKEKAISAGKEYVKKYGNITESSLSSEYNLPTSKVIYSLFGSMASFQQAVGSEVSKRNEYVTKEEIKDAVNQYFGEKERIIDTIPSFLKTFRYSPSTIHKRYGSFNSFCRENNITVLNSKKAKFTKQEVDDAIAEWIKSGKDIPNAKSLAVVGLPSAGVILKYYDDWKEPFILYRKLYEKLIK